MVYFPAYFVPLSISIYPLWVCGLFYIYWNGQLVWTPALGLYLCVCLWGCPRHVERQVAYHVRLLLNVELRNYVISCQNLIK